MYTVGVSIRRIACVLLGEGRRGARLAESRVSSTVLTVSRRGVGTVCMMINSVSTLTHSPCALCPPYAESRDARVCGGRGASHACNAQPLKGQWQDGRA